MRKIETLAATLAAVATPGTKPKEIIAAVRERHPEASKRDVVRAAFYALTAGDAIDPEQSKHLHQFALGERAAATESAEAEPAKPKKATRKKA